MRFLHNTVAVLAQYSVWQPFALAMDVTHSTDNVAAGTASSLSDPTPTAAGPNPTRNGLGSDPIDRSNDPLDDDDDYFRVTPENRKASGAGEAYSLWIANVDKNSSRWLERRSEPEFFAMDVLEWSEPIECGNGVNGGCYHVPRCEDIQRRIRNKEHARQICYIFYSIVTLNTISASVYVSPSPPSSPSMVFCF